MKKMIFMFCLIGMMLAKPVLLQAAKAKFSFIMLEKTLKHTRKLGRHMTVYLLLTDIFNEKGDTIQQQLICFEKTPDNEAFFLKHYKKRIYFEYHTQTWSDKYGWVEPESYTGKNSTHRTVPLIFNLGDFNSNVEKDNSSSQLQAYNYPNSSSQGVSTNNGTTGQDPEWIRRRTVPAPVPVSQPKKKKR